MLASQSLLVQQMLTHLARTAGTQQTRTTIPMYVVGLFVYFITTLLMRCEANKRWADLTPRIWLVGRVHPATAH